MNVAVLRRDERTARAIEQALGLPGPNWATVEVTFGMDEPASAKVTLLISQEQLHALVNASTNIGGGA